MIKMFLKFLFSSRAYITLMPATAVDRISFDEGYLPASHAVLATPEAYPPEDEQELNLPTARRNRFRVSSTFGLLHQPYGIEVSMSKLRHIQVKARQLARSGTFYGWPPIEFELQFEEGFSEAHEWLHSSATQDELHDICRGARERRVRHQNLNTPSKFIIP